MTLFRKTIKLHVIVFIVAASQSKGRALHCSDGDRVVLVQVLLLLVVSRAKGCGN